MVWVFFVDVWGVFFPSDFSVGFALVEYMTGEFLGKRWVSKDDKV